MKTVALYFMTFAAGLMIGRGLVSAQAVPPEIMHSDIPSVTGIGGVFFKSSDPAKLRAWYQQHLGINAAPHGSNFFWREEFDASQFGRTVWSVFPEETTYFGAGRQDLMINYRVRNLDSLLVNLRTQGVQQVGGVDDYWYGRFAWIIDGEGNRVELWEPVNLSPEEFEHQMKLNEASR